jgi:hypothetical protein
MLVAVILDRDFDFFPTHIEINDDVTDLVVHGNLRPRRR